MSRRALFVAIPLLGHINPLLAQAAELRQRGWLVHLASTEEVRQAVQAQAPDVDFVSIGADPNGPNALPELQTRVAARRDFISGTVDIMRWVNTLWPVMFDGVVACMRTLAPDIAVVDMVSTAGLDAAERLRVPLVVNNADLLTTLSVAVLPPAPRVPLLFSGRSISQIGTLERVLNPARRMIGTVAVDLTLGRQLNALRRSRGLPPKRLTRRVANSLVMTNSAFGLEYSRPLPPLLQMVGPMLEFESPPPPLPTEMARWLDEGPPVVFVNLGTFARTGSALTGRIAGGLQSYDYRALWVLRGPQPDIPPNVRVEQWVTSQVSVLAHPNVGAFVSHCGVNSVHESLFAGTPVVGIPLLADQHDMALRVVDAGVGVLLEKQRFDSADLRARIEDVLRNDGYRRAIPAIQSSFRLAGGVKRAADLIEHVATFGVAHFSNDARARTN
jgi:UDP:flavonoid glycosyltransferase YjiC (YdhE family)